MYRERERDIVDAVCCYSRGRLGHRRKGTPGTGNVY